MARGREVLCMSRWLQCFLGPQAFLTALGENHRFVARYITINGNKESKWWLKRWTLRVWTELLCFLWKPCHLFWAAYENKVGLGAGFYGFGLTQEQFLQVKLIQDYILVSFILQHNKKGGNAKKKDVLDGKGCQLILQIWKRNPQDEWRVLPTQCCGHSVFGCGSILKRQEVHIHRCNYLANLSLY